MTHAVKIGNAAGGTIALRDDAWDAFVAHHSQAHFLQTSAWARLKCRFAWQRTIAAVEEEQRVAAGASILLRQVAGLTMAYVPRGPVVDWANSDLVTETLAQTAAQARRVGASALRIEPELPDSPAARQLLRAHGFRPSPQTVQPPSTIVLDISGQEDDVLQRMKSKWRYNVRLSQRKGVTVRPLARGELPRFQELMDETGTRDGFALHSADYYAAAYDLFCDGLGAFLIAEYESKPLGALVVVSCGSSAWYLWGASSSRERSRMPNHALQWAAMQWARAQGAVRYDFWGIPDAIGQAAVGLRQGDGSGAPVEEMPINLEALPREGLWGVYRFKQGFGGHVVRHVGTWDLPLAPLGGRIFALGLAAQPVARRMVRRGPAEPEEATKTTPAGAWESISTAAAWREALAALPDVHVLQSWEWGEVKRQTGWIPTRLVYRGVDGRPQAAMQFLERRLLPYLPIRIGYVPKGPVVDWDDDETVKRVLDQVVTHARRRRCIFVKIDPDVAEAARSGVLLRYRFQQRGWRYSHEQIQFKNSATTDLRMGTEALFSGMKSKWRYNVRLAERRGIRVRRGRVPYGVTYNDVTGNDASDVADLEAFYRLYAETGARDGFLIRPYAYYAAPWTTFLRAQDDEINPAGGALLLAEHDEEPGPVAGVLLLRYGTRTWYFYGASSERRRRDMPNYLLQWRAMQWALEQGCTVYDWWGAPTDPDDPDDEMQGVWQFKRGFGAVFAARIGAWDHVVAPSLYALYSEWTPRLMALLRRLRTS